MNAEEKILLLANTVETDPGQINPQKALKDIEEWDSFARISVLAMFTKQFGRELSIDTLNSFVTVNDVLNEMHK